MVQGSGRTRFTGSALVRLLAQLGTVEVKDSRQAFAELVEALGGVARAEVVAPPPEHRVQVGDHLAQIRVASTSGRQLSHLKSVMPMAKPPSSIAATSTLAMIRAAEARGVRIWGEVELATKLLAHPAPIVAIGGTNGKSTVTSLVDESIT